MKTLKRLLLGSLLALSSSTFAEPIGTAFTYQGELQQLGNPANGTFDFQFDLYNVAIDGSPVTTTVQSDDAVVVDGIFTVELNFGSAVFNGDQLWLEIAVRDGSSEGDFSALSPRQLITATPFAVQALTVPDGSITGDQIDPTSVQKRVSGACAAGFLIRAINADGSVLCEPDADTTLSESQVDAFTANNGYSTGPHTVDTDTTLSEDEVDTFVANNDYSLGPHTVDTDTTYDAGTGLYLEGNRFFSLHPNPENVIWVSDSGADFTSIQSAIDSITGSADDNRYLIKVGPGIYSEQVNMKPFVHIEGSGENVTVITSESDCSLGSGTVNGSNNSELRHLTVESTSIESVQLCAIVNDQASPRLIHVTARSSGGSQSRAIYNIDSSPELIDVTARSSGGSQSQAIYNVDSSPNLIDVTAIAGPASSSSHGILNYGSSPTMLRVYSEGTGSPSNNIGLSNQPSPSNPSTPKLDQITAVASGDNASNEGIRFISSEKQVLSRSKVVVTGDNSSNIGINNSGVELTVLYTDVLVEGADGASQGIRHSSGQMRAEYVTIKATNSGGVGTQTIGFEAGSNTSSSLLSTNIATTGGGNVSVGVIASLGEEGNMTISQSRIVAEADTARGISVESSPENSLEVTNSEISGTTHSVFNISTLGVRIGSTQLINPIGTSGSGILFICVGSYDETFVALNPSCL